MMVESGSNETIELPQVEVILPFHRCDLFLRQAIESVSNSLNVKISLLLVDDRLSEEINVQSELESVLENVNYRIIRNHNHGYGRSLNLGLQEVRAEFVALMNSDDLISPHKFHRQITKLQETNSDIIICRLQKFFNGSFIPALAGIPDLGLYSSKLLLLGAYGADATLLGRWEIMNEFRFDESSKTCDWITAFTEFPKLEIVGLNEALYFYRSHENQLTQNVEYAGNSFTGVYPYWRKFNDSLGLPALNEETAMVIAFPSAMSRGHTVDWVQLGVWIESYLKLFNGREHLEASNIIKRRLVAARFVNRRVSRHLKTTIQMGVEFLSLKFLGAQPK